MKKRNFRREGSILLAVASVVATLTACSSSGATAPISSAKPSDLRGQTIKVMVSSGHQQFNPVWATELPKWEAQTGIKVELDKVNTTDISSVFQRDVTTGGCTLDNVEMLDGGTAAAAPHMADLDQFLKSDGSSAAKLLENQVGFAQKAYTFNGKLAFYPFYSGSKAVAYRKSWFADPKNQAAFQAKYGYKLPDPPTTAQQVKDVAAFFSNGPTKGIVFSGSGDPAETTLADLAFRNGVSGYQDANGNAQWGPKNPSDQTRVEDAAKYLTGFISDGDTPDAVGAMQTADTTSNFLAGNTAMDYDHIYLSWNKMKDAQAKLGNIGSFEFPSLQDGQGGISFYWGRGIPDCSKHKEASWEFMKWIMSPDIQKIALSKGVGVYVPTDKSLLSWSVQQGLVPQGVADSVSHAKAYQVTPVTNQLRQSIDIPLVEKLIGKQLSPEEYAKTSGSQMQDAADAAGLAH